ncbi:arsenic resistance N-acetyltransferase ArsN2 [Novosphingobium rosa]|uniref:arsenic resistance N-acetyltransferase ArsN2 n=1 Tax=Novosphingobium rosa TaxID=76978 RepID=UPI00082B8549|nr:arsenic resistance N-acetyltransferase ArsN2 [Novosphingobium rosa]
MTAIAVVPLRGDELGEMVHHLSAAGLIHTDVEGPNRWFFRVENLGLIGFAGLEGQGADRLLRSVVVAPDRRGQGLGCRLVEAVEDTARSQGVQRLHLLTTTAAPFFRALGYGDADRSAAPTTIANSREFANLCPASAAYLVKDL